MAKRRQTDTTPPSEPAADSIAADDANVLQDFEPHAEPDATPTAGGAELDEPPVDVLQDFQPPGGAPTPALDSLSEKTTPKNEPASPVRVVTLADIPLRRTAAYVPHHLPPLDGRYAQIARDLADGLAARGEKLPSGELIRSPDAALRWLLDRLTAAQ